MWLLLSVLTMIIPSAMSASYSFKMSLDNLLFLTILQTFRIWLHLIFKLHVNAVNERLHSFSIILETLHFFLLISEMYTSGCLCDLSLLWFWLMYNVVTECGMHLFLFDSSSYCFNKSCVAVFC